MASDSETSVCGRFRPLKRMKSAHRKNSSGNSKYVCESVSSDSDSVDCEIIMEGSYGKLHEQWEQAALKKQFPSDMEYKRLLSGMEYQIPYVEEEVSVSGSNVYPSSPSREFEQEGKNEQANGDFQKHHSDKYSTDPPDLVSSCGIVYTSSQDPPDLVSSCGIVYTSSEDEVTSHRTPKEPEIQNPRVEIFNGASIDQSTNNVEIKPSKEAEEAQRQWKRIRAEDGQKRRPEEKRETQNKDEETTELKEKLRCKVASQSKDMASLSTQSWYTC